MWTSLDQKGSRSQISCLRSLNIGLGLMVYPDPPMWEKKVERRSQDLACSVVQCAVCAVCGVPAAFAAAVLRAGHHNGCAVSKVSVSGAEVAVPMLCRHRVAAGAGAAATAAVIAEQCHARAVEASASATQRDALSHARCALVGLVGTHPLVHQSTPSKSAARRRRARRQRQRLWRLACVW
jgi:hypothetical protein